MKYFNGKVTIDDVNLLYDNTIYFNVNKREKIKVLSINENDDTFLKRYILMMNLHIHHLSLPL